MFLSLMILCTIIHNHGSTVVISGEQNKNIILPCSFKPDKSEVIHWTTRDEKNVHSYYDRTDQLQNQDKDYSGRTSLFLDEISKGNASLQIRDLKKSDGNTYMCYVGTEGGSTEYGVTLQVKGSTVLILGEQNKNIILPCSFKPDRNEVIHWNTRDKKNVHSYYDRTDQLQNQDKDYSGRTSLFLDEISKGNASLQIRDLKKSDGNTYMCYVGTEGGSTEDNIALKVIGFQHLMEYNWDNRGLLTLTCSVNTSSSEDIIIKWYENGQNVKNDHNTKSSHTILNNSLKYQCTVDHAIVQSRWTGTWTMKERTLKKDDNISCGCSICQHDFYLKWNFRQGNNEVPIASMNNSSPTISADYKNRVDNSQEHHLNLAKLSANDNGIYTCLIVTQQTTDIEMTSVNIIAEETRRDRTPLCAPFIVVFVISCITFKFVQIKKKDNSKLQRVSPESSSRQLEGTNSQGEGHLQL
ncbi:HERV-H LTR-associating protein 2 [Eleutherodactylus coqui]|uniref:HERV-H LTR-associating protein 2 n=1 Tax=Eleutherodactylus coqui TaxID=57060 RepID=UPI003463822A